MSGVGSRMHVCPRCLRHFRVTERRCPFCASASGWLSAGAPLVVASQCVPGGAPTTPGPPPASPAASQMDLGAGVGGTPGLDAAVAAAPDGAAYDDDDP